ncbi:MAG: hypothetical protein ACFCGT_27740 [Sandaracinaceae bacterium]
MTVGAAVFAAVLAWPCLASGQGPGTPPAPAPGPGERPTGRIAADLEAEGLRLYRDLLARRHDPGRSPRERECLETVLPQVSALLDAVAHRAAADRLDGRALERGGRTLGVLRAHAEDVCAVSRDTEGEVDVSSWREPRLPRDTWILRLGGAWHLASRVQLGRYRALPRAGSLEAGLGGFPLPLLRVEGTFRAGWARWYGPFASLGVRALVTSDRRWLRVAAGLSLAGTLARDRAARNRFGWLGVVVGIPLEVAMEISDRFGLSASVTPTLTKPGDYAVRPGVSVALRMELPL